MLNAKSSEKSRPKLGNLTVFWGLGSGVSKSCYFYSKRHVLAWTHVVWAILRQNRSRGVTSRLVGEKSKKVTDSHRKDMSPLTQGLIYRSACDYSQVFNTCFFEKHSTLDMAYSAIYDWLDYTYILSSAIFLPPELILVVIFVLYYCLYYCSIYHCQRIYSKIIRVCYCFLNHCSSVIVHTTHSLLGAVLLTTLDRFGV